MYTAHYTVIQNCCEGHKKGEAMQNVALASQKKAKPNQKNHQKQKHTKKQTKAPKT